LDGRKYAGSNGWQYYMLVRYMGGWNIRAMESYRLCMLNNYLIDISTLLGCGTVSLRLMCGISGQLCLKTRGTNHPVTQVHLSEENRPQLHCCKSLKTSQLLYCYWRTV